MAKTKLHMEIGLKLRNLREGLKLRSEDMGRKLGISRTAYGNLENGRSIPGTKTMMRLTQHFNVSLDWLLFDKGTMYLTEKEELLKLREKNKALEAELEKERSLHTAADEEDPQAISPWSIMP